METVVASCIQCKSELGRFWNSWNGIGNTYHRPIYPPVSVNGLESTGLIYNGAEDSAVEYSQLQDIACEKCRTVVGLRCDNAPAGHLLKKNQLIMRLTSMSVISMQTGQKAKILVLKTFPLKTTSVKKHLGARRDSTCRPDSHIPSPGVGSIPAGSQSVVARIPAAGARSLAPLNVPVADIVKFKNWAEDAISTQQADIERISGTVNRIERDMRSLKDFMLEMRNERSSNKEIPTILDERNVQALQGDLDLLRQQVEQKSETLLLSSTNLLEKTELISQEVEIIGRKAYEVDDLRSQLELIKGQVEHQEIARAIGVHVTDPSSDVGQFPFLGSAKRNHGGFRSSLIENDRDASPKRRKLALSTSGDKNSNMPRYPEKTLDHQPTSKRDITELVSSEADSTSPIREQNNNHGQVSQSMQAERAPLPVHKSHSSIIAARCQNGNRGKPAVMKTHAIKDAATPAPLHTSRLQVVVPYSPALPILSLQQKGRSRDTKNRTDGQKIKRSLRLSGRARKEFLAPASPVIHVSDEGYAPANVMRSIENCLSIPVTRSRDSILSSPVSPSSNSVNKDTEKERDFMCDSFGTGYDNIQDLDRINADCDECSKIDEDSSREYKCEKCKKSYTIIQRLEYVREPDPKLILEKETNNFEHQKYSKCGTR
ncbi:unnamed protein product [Diplocarpon coronariae]